MMLQSASILAKKISVTGTMRVEGDFHLYGNFVGDLYAEDPNSTVYLERGSTFKGNLYATTLHIQGLYEGTLNSRNAHFHPSATVRGEVYVVNLEIDFGADVEAKIHRV